MYLKIIAIALCLMVGGVAVADEDVFEPNMGRYLVVGPDEYPSQYDTVEFSISTELNSAHEEITMDVELNDSEGVVKEWSTTGGFEAGDIVTVEGEYTFVDAGDYQLLFNIGGYDETEINIEIEEVETDSYTVEKRGETGHNIAERSEDFDIDKLFKFNPGVEWNNIQIGQELNIPKGAEVSEYIAPVVEPVDEDENGEDENGVDEEDVDEEEEGEGRGGLFYGAITALLACGGAVVYSLRKKSKKM